MSTRVFTLYRLNDGVDVEEFKRWSLEVDQPTCHRMESCHRFEVHLITGGSQGDVSFDVIEDIDVESWEGWQRDQASEGFSQIREEWPRFGDAGSLISFECEKIQ
jgi:hypothetical protein